MAEITGHTKTTCLIGKPTEHSLSPTMHNLSYQHLGIDAIYTAYDVEPENLAAVVEGFKGMEGLVGCNVTMPHKRAIIPLLDGISDSVELIDSVNVVEFKDGKAYGHNSDGIGFMTNLRAHGVVIEGATITLLGPGGAGSAIFAQAALDGVAKIHLFARANGKSHKTAEEMIPRVVAKTGCEVLLHDLEDQEALKMAIDDSSVLINATNVGMGEGNTETPIPTDLIRPGIVVADAIYFPRETQFLADARALGNTAINGLGMLLYQAAVSEEIWFGAQMPVELIEEKVFS